MTCHKVRSSTRFDHPQGAVIHEVQSSTMFALQEVPFPKMFSLHEVLSTTNEVCSPRGAASQGVCPPRCAASQEVCPPQGATPQEVRFPRAVCHEVFPTSSSPRAVLHEQSSPSCPPRAVEPTRRVHEELRAKLPWRQFQSVLIKHPSS